MKAVFKQYCFTYYLNNSITQTPLVTNMFDRFLNHVQSLLLCYRDALSPGAERAAVPNRYGGVAPLPKLLSSSAFQTHNITVCYQKAGEEPVRDEAMMELSWIISVCVYRLRPWVGWPPHWDHQPPPQPGNEGAVPGHGPVVLPSVLTHTTDHQW